MRLYRFSFGYILLIFLFFACNKFRRPKKKHESKPKKDLIFKQDLIARDTVNLYNKYFDVKHYDIDLQIEPKKKSIKGSTKIIYRSSKPLDLLQLDLQFPLQVDSIKSFGKILDFTRIREKILVHLNQKTLVDKDEAITIYYHGQPKVTNKAPWKSGMVWQKDSLGRDFIGVACQHLGGSLWFPCKDLWSDKADYGVNIRLVLPKNLIGVANGRLLGVKAVDTMHNAYRFKYNLPISTYNISFYAGAFVHWNEVFSGLKGMIQLQYYVLDYHQKQAILHFSQIPGILQAFEYWLGSYPFYGMPLSYVESPYLGMEHQGAIAYGNGYKNGYMGRDLSSSGYGLFWDFILVHETAHQWFGNRVSARSRRDMWIQESFADYAEALYMEYVFGKQAALSYEYGKRTRIENKVPIITDTLQFYHGTDMYFKGGNMLQTLRSYINNDEKFRIMLNTATTTFSWPLSSQAFLKWMQQFLHKDLTSFFHYYLYTKKPPILQYKLLESENKILFRYARVGNDFNFPIEFADSVIQPKRNNWVSVNLGNKFMLYPRYLEKLFQRYYFQFIQVKGNKVADDI